MRLYAIRLLVGLAVLALAGPLAAQSDSGPSAFKSLRYRSIGPAAGGRVCRVAGVPGDPLTYYAATASGGVWKSADGGLNWRSTFDDQPCASIGSLAVAPSNPNVLYVGAGEANIRGNVVEGDGIYKSTDAGKTWTHVWKQRGQIGTVAIHPTNADIAFAAVLGRAFGPNPERGVYRTTDGGKSWKRVLFKDNDSGASDVGLDPSNPLVIFAGTWQARRRPWELVSGGPGSGLFVSRDGGDTWKQLKEKGLPEGTWGKVGVAVAPSDNRRVYALIEADKGGLFRSDDGGDSWRLVSADRNIRQRAFYYTTITVDPKNPDVVYCPNVSLYRSGDGGRTFRPVAGTHHSDHHDVWLDPTNPKRMIDAHDGGVDVTTNGGESWHAPSLPISQFYHIACDDAVPYRVMGAMQDLGTASGPSNSLTGGGIALADWYSVGGGEAGHAVPDPSDPNIVYAGEYGGYISRYDHRTRQARNVSVYPIAAVGKSGAELKYRFQWTSPILVSRHDPKTIYHGANVLFRSTDGGQRWEPVGGDLTRNDKAKQGFSGGPLTGDNTGVEIYATIFALAESPLAKDVLWAGSDDGLVHLSRDGGRTWTNVTPPGLPEWCTVACIETSRADADTAYVVVDGHRIDDVKPYLFKTADGGKTWTSLASGLPQDVPLHVVREDRRGLLFAGNDRGVFFSTDDGKAWRPLRLNLPTVPVHDLVVKGDDLVVGTHGRSIWILDDLTPLRELTPEVAAKPAHLFTTRDVVRRRGGGRGARGGAAIGENPPAGAVVHYHLKAKPKGDVTLEIVDSADKVVKLLSSKAEPADETPAEEGRRGFGGRTRLTTDVGVNRVVWDLTHEGPKTIKGAVGWPSAPTAGPTALPGTYRLRLKVDGQTLTSEMTLRPDGRVGVSGEQLAEQQKLALQARDQISHVTGLVTQLRAVKRQLAARDEALKDEPTAKELLTASKALTTKIDVLEGKFHNTKAEIPYDILGTRGGSRVYSQLSNLFFTVASGDGAPTQGMRETFDDLAKEVKELETEWAKLLKEDVARLNEAARKAELPALVVPKAARP